MKISLTRLMRHIPHDTFPEGLHDENGNVDVAHLVARRSITPTDATWFLAQEGYGPQLIELAVKWYNLTPVDKSPEAERGIYLASKWLLDPTSVNSDEFYAALKALDEPKRPRLTDNISTNVILSILPLHPGADPSVSPKLYELSPRVAQVAADGALDYIDAIGTGADYVEAMIILVDLLDAIE
jgi:hypothetical protein